MVRLTERAAVRALLQLDRVWSIYALGDLGAAYWPSTTWYSHGDEVSLVLKAYSMPILWASGSMAGLTESLEEECYSVQLRPAALAALALSYRTEGLKRMWRMTVDAASFRPAAGEAERLVDAGEVVELYRNGEMPEF